MSSVSDDDSVILVDAPVDPSKHLLLYPVEYHQVGRFLDIRLKENDCTIYNTGHVLRLPNPSQNTEEHSSAGSLVVYRISDNSVDKTRRNSIRV
jgi:hypothetical protein